MVVARAGIRAADEPGCGTVLCPLQTALSTGQKLDKPQACLGTYRSRSTESGMGRVVSLRRASSSVFPHLSYVSKQT